MSIADRSIFERPHRGGIHLAEGVRLGENWHPGDPANWSSNLRSTVVLELGAFDPPPRLCVIGLCAFNARPDAPQNIKIASAGHPETVVTLVNETTHLVIVPAPVRQSTEDEVEIALTIDHIASPRKIGLSLDERYLGVRIASFEVITQPVAFPLRFDAQADAACRTVLVSGWAAPDEFGTWATAEAAQIALPRDLWYQKPVLRLKVHALERPVGDRPMVVTALANGQGVAQWKSGDAGSWDLDLKTHWSNGQDLILTLRHENRLSPQDLGMSVDSRPLGLFLQRMEPA